MVVIAHVAPTALDSAARMVITVLAGTAFRVAATRVVSATVVVVADVASATLDSAARVVIAVLAGTTI